MEERLELALVLASSSDGQVSVEYAQKMSGEDLIKSLKYYQIKNKAVSNNKPMPDYDTIKRDIK